MTATKRRMCRFKREVLKVILLLSIVVLVQAKVGPKFTKTPKKEYRVYQGDTVKLRCSVTGAEDPMHNRTLTAWKKFGGKAGGVIRKSRAWRRFRVTNGKYLRIRNAKVEDSGTYLCVAKNQDGTITAVIKLFVKALDVPATNSTLSDVTTKGSPTTAVKRAPVFRNEERIRTLNITAGRQLKLRCHARGVPTPKIQWFKKNKKLEKNRKHRRRIIKWTLRFSRVAPTDSGTYSCFVWNQYGNITKTFIVRVKGRVDGKSFSPAPVQRKPVIQKHLLSNATATVGELVTFSCTALSMLVPRFTWLKWTALNSTSNETVKITVLNSSYPNVRFVRESSRWSGDKMSYCHKLKLINITEADQGRYTCVVGSTAGFVSSDVYLTVRSKRSKDKKDDTLPNSSSSSNNLMGYIQIPLAALIAVPIAFGFILIVAIIWCYIQTVKHRYSKFKMNSQPLACPIANGLATHPTSNGIYREVRTNGIVMETVANGNACYRTDGFTAQRAYPRGIVLLECSYNLHSQTDLQNESHEESTNDTALGSSHENIRDTSPDHSLDPPEEEPYVCLPQEIQNGLHCQDHPGVTLNADSDTNNENSILQEDCDKECSSEDVPHIRNSVV